MAGREILSGEVGPLGLPALLQLVAIERLTGWFRVIGAGVITFDTGRVIAAEFGALRGRDALRALLFGASGPFTFVPGTSTGAEAVAEIAGEALEVCRIRDEWARLGDKVFVVGRGGIDDVEVARLAERFDGVRTLHEAAAAAGVLPTLVADGLLHALGRGALVELRRGSSSLAVRDDDDVAARMRVVDDDDEAPIGGPSRAPPRETPAPLERAPSGAGGAVEGAPAPPTGDVEAALEVQVAAPTPTVEALAPGVVDPGDLVDLARERARAGELIEAEVLLRRAVELRPGDRVAQQNLRRVLALRASGDSPPDLRGSRV